MKYLDLHLKKILIRQTSFLQKKTPLKSPGLLELILTTLHEHRVSVEMKLIPTAYSGSCYLIQADSKRKENSIYIGYKDYLTKKNVPKQFTIYFTTNNDWHGIVNDKWVGYQYPLQIDTGIPRCPRFRFLRFLNYRS